MRKFFEEEIWRLKGVLEEREREGEVLRKRLEEEGGRKREGLEREKVLKGELNNLQTAHSETLEELKTTRVNLKNLRSENQRLVTASFRPGGVEEMLLEEVERLKLEVGRKVEEGREEGREEERRRYEVEREGLREEIERMRERSFETTFVEEVQEGEVTELRYEREEDTLVNVSEPVVPEIERNTASTQTVRVVSVEEDGGLREINEELKMDNVELSRLVIELKERVRGGEEERRIMRRRVRESAVVNNGFEKVSLKNETERTRRGLNARI